MYGMTPVGVFFIAFFPLKINEHALCQQPHDVSDLWLIGRPFARLKHKRPLPAAQAELPQIVRTVEKEPW